ncbi:hypothetical protein [Staphylococcus sp. 11262D007BW]
MEKKHTSFLIITIIVSLVIGFIGKGLFSSESYEGNWINKETDESILNIKNGKLLDKNGDVMEGFTYEEVSANKDIDVYKLEVKKDDTSFLDIGIALEKDKDSAVIVLQNDDGNRALFNTYKD